MLPTLRVPLLLGVLAALWLTLGSALAADETADYVTLSPPVPTASGDQVEVVEVFLYSCPHCWHLEPLLKTWAGTQPAGVVFRRMPASRSESHVRAFYAAEALGQLENYHLALFKAWHVERKPILTEDDLVKLAGANGIDEKAFREAYNSFAVETKVRKAADLTRRYGIDGVPAVIVNGKFRTSPSQTGGDKDRFIAVLNTLVGQELAAKGSAAAATPAPAAPAPAVIPTPAAPAAGN